MKRTFLLALTLLTLTGLSAPAADTKDQLLHATLVEELGGKEVTSFSKDAPKIYAIWKGDAVKKGDKVRSVWIADDVGTAAPKNTKIDEATVTVANNPTGNFSLSKPDKGWPVGKYRLELYVGDKLVETLKFTISDDGDDE